MMCRIAVETLPEDLYAQPDACAYAAASRRRADFGAAGTQSRRSTAANAIGRASPRLARNHGRLRTYAGQDATLAKLWLEREFSKIQALAKKEKAAIFFGNESGVRSDFHPGTTWGNAVRLQSFERTGRRFRLNMISAISARGELKFMTSTYKITAPLFIEFLKRLIVKYPKKSFLIVDGSSTHKAKAVERYLETVKDRLRLFFFPPYAPEINHRRVGLERGKDSWGGPHDDPHPE